MFIYRLIPCVLITYGLILFDSTPSYAFLDFVGEQTKKIAEVSAYMDAATELSSEVLPDKDLEAGAKDIQRRSEAIRNETSRLKYLSHTTQNVLNGPDWSSKRIENNIRSTTEYVKRLKQLIAKAMVLGNEGAIALNTTETNVALNEIQKNQQTLILQNSEAELRKMEKEHEEARQWSMFTESQRKIRNQRIEPNGKL